MMATKFQKLFGKSKTWITLQGSRKSSTSLEKSTPAKVKISEHIELWKMQSSNQSFPLVLMFTWLKSPMSVVQKYANLYHHRGMDVLVVRGTAKHFLRPSYSFQLGYELEKCLNEIPSYQKYLVHCFSIGTYNYTLAQMTSRSGVPCFPSEKVIGQIYDSIAFGSIEHMVSGLAISITNRKILQRIIKTLVLLYIHLTSKYTRDIYDNCVEFFKQKLLPVPSLFFYCENDPVCNLKFMKESLALQREKHGDKIWEKSWPISAHVGHLRLHQDDYVAIWNSFLNKLGL